MQSLIRADSLFGTWKADLLSGKTPERFAMADEDSPLSGIQAGPNRVILLGGQPGGGKTALVMQLAVDALRLSADLRVLACNVEMLPESLMDRQLSRLSGVALNSIQDRQFTTLETQRLHSGLAELESVSSRLAFCGGPFTLEAVATACDQFEPQILILDYLQRFTATASAGTDKRGGIEHLMSMVRHFAGLGCCVFVVSALSRQKNSQGRNSYDAETLTMAAFRDSSELEFGADDAFILTTGKEPSERTLKHLKSRNGECRDIPLEFAGAVQRFSGTFVDDIGKQAESWWQG